MNRFNGRRDRHRDGRVDPAGAPGRRAHVRARRFARAAAGLAALLVAAGAVAASPGAHGALQRAPRGAATTSSGVMNVGDAYQDTLTATRHDGNGNPLADTVTLAVTGQPDTGEARATFVPNPIQTPDAGATFTVSTTRRTDAGHCTMSVTGTGLVYGAYGPAVVVAASAWPARAAADAGAPDAPAVVAGIAHGALVVRADGGPARALQQGGGARSLPVWSADGRRIAFVQAIDPHQGLADVVVVDTEGRERARVTIEPAQPGVADAGMRGVESLRWLSATRLAVRGSLNPSQSQYDVVDTTSGQVVDDFTDDRSSAAFSPDGLHVASQDGSPHFTPAGRRAPTMNVDGRVVYPPSGSAHAGQVFLSPPRWSDDGHALAWVVRDAGATHPALALWRDGAVREVALPAAGWQAARVAWSGTHVLVRPVDDDGGPVAGARPAGWSVDARSGRVDTVADAAAVDPLAAARALRERLRAQARANGLAMPDVWCAHCALAVLPRESD